MGPRKFRPVIRKSELEKADTEGPKWWTKYLTEIETEICKPSIHRPEVVYSVVSKRETFKMVSAILKLDEAECDQLCIREAERDRLAKLELERLEREARLRDEMRTFKAKSKGSVNPTLGDAGIAMDSDEDSEEDEEEYQSSSSTESSKEVEEEEEIEPEAGSDLESKTSIEMQGFSQHELVQSYDAYSNPYLRFLRRPPERAATWRPRPQPSPTGVYRADPNLTLIEKSEAVTNKIASDFCTWMRDLGGSTQPEIDEKMLIELFQFEFDKPAARGLANRIREHPTLAPDMAKKMEIPELDYRLFVREQIRQDIVAEGAKPMLMGFGTQIDETGRVDPPRNHTKAQWTGSKSPSDLASFTPAFAGLSHIESFVGYCKYLAQNPHLRRPPCLQAWGMFEEQRHALVSCEPSHSSIELELQVATILMADAVELSSSSLVPGAPVDTTEE